MNIKLTLATLCTAFASPAMADDVFDQRPGFSIDLSAARAFNTDDMATDFEGGHSMTKFAAGYRLRTGTELFVGAGFVMGGHESIMPTWGAGLRQRFAFGKIEPFIDAGIYDVGDDERLDLAFGIGAGVDVQLNRRVYVGLAGGHYFSNDSNEIGGLDWWTDLHVGLRL